jgi:excisionase family DNA binding protein
MEKVLDNREQQAPGFATAAEAAQFLKIAKATVHNEINRGNIPAVRFGRAVRIPWSWLRSQAAA